MAKEEKKNTAASAEDQPSNKDTVEVERGVLESILSRQESYEKVIADQSKQLQTQASQIDRLMGSADKSRLEYWDRLHQSGELIRQANIRYFKEKDTDKWALVLGWSGLVVDEVGVRDGRIEAKQIMKVFLDQGNGNEPKEQLVDILDFARFCKYEPADIIETKKSRNGEFYKLRLQDGREVEFDIRFLN